jgi:hypothetical protein
MGDFELADDFLPVYDVSDAVATTAEADHETAWRALLDVDLLKLGREAPLVGMLGALRMLPEVVGHLLHGERPAKPPESMRLRDLPSIPMRRVDVDRAIRRGCQYIDAAVQQLAADNVPVTDHLLARLSPLQ